VVADFRFLSVVLYSALGMPIQKLILLFKAVVHLAC
jgi:hypothetical protein